MFRNLFVKDLRAVTWEASILVVLYGVYAWLVLQPLPGDLDAPRHLINSAPPYVLLIFVTWLVIAARIVQHESPGDVRSYWRTRPISGSRLLGSKAAALVALISIPALSIQLTILFANSFSLIPLWTDLLKAQVNLWSYCVLPLFAIASLTRSVASMVFTIACCLLASFYLPLLILSSTTEPGVAFTLVAFDHFTARTLAAAGALVVLAFQYIYRRKWAAWLVLALYLAAPASLTYLAHSSRVTGRPTNSTAEGQGHLVVGDLIRPRQPVSVLHGDYYYELPLRLDGDLESNQILTALAVVQETSPALVTTHGGTYTFENLYFLRDGQPRIVFKVPAAVAGQSDRAVLNLRIRLQGVLHAHPQEERHPALSRELVWNHRLHCLGVEENPLVHQVQCVSAFLQNPTLLLRTPTPSGEIGVLLIPSENGATAGNAMGPSSVFNPVAYLRLSDILTSVSGFPWPEGLRESLDKGATVETLEAGEWRTWDLVIPKLELEFPRTSQEQIARTAP